MGGVLFSSGNPKNSEGKKAKDSLHVVHNLANIWRDKKRRLEDHYVILPDKLLGEGHFAQVVPQCTCCDETHVMHHHHRYIWGRQNCQINTEDRW